MQVQKMNEKQVALIKAALNVYVSSGYTSEEEFETFISIHDYFDLEKGKEKESHLDENLIKE